MPVLTPDDAYGPGEVVGELRQLRRAAGEVLDGRELRRRPRRDGLRLLDGRLRARLRMLKRPADLGGEVHDPARQVCDLFSGVGGPRGGLGDLVQVADPVRRALGDCAQLRADPLEELRRSVEGLARILSGFADIARLAPARL